MMSMDEKFYEDLVKTSKQDPKLTNLQVNYNLDSGFIKELETFLSIHKFKNPQEVSPIFKKEFKDYNFYFKIGLITNFTNVRFVMVRYNQLVPLDSLSDEIKAELRKKIQNEETIRNSTIEITEENNNYEYWVLWINKKSKSLDLATEYSHKELAKSLGVLNLISEKYFLSYYKKFHPCYIIEENSKFQSTYSMVELEEKFHLTDHMIDTLNRIAHIFKNNSKNDIDKRIIKAFDIYSQIQKSTEPTVKIVIYMTILENLLLDENDKDYLNWKLADRISFLIGDKKPIVDNVIYPDFNKDYEGREANNKYVINAFVKKLYDIRSSLVHSSKSNMEIDMFDKFLLIGHNIILNVIAEFLNLESNGITKLKDPSNGLVKRLENLKYNNPVTF